jgi:hypothetical protein
MTYDEFVEKLKNMREKTYGDLCSESEALVDHLATGSFQKIPSTHKKIGPKGETLRAQDYVLSRAETARDFAALEDNLIDYLLICNLAASPEGIVFQASLSSIIREVRHLRKSCEHDAGTDLSTSNTEGL